MPLAARPLLLLAPGVAGSALSVAAAQPPSSEAVSIQADTVLVDLDRGRTEARGAALLSYQDLRLHGDAITAEESTGQVQAAGHLAFAQHGRRFEASSLQYNLRTDEGVLSHARLEEQGLVIHGDRLECSPRRVVAHNAYFTTCDRPRPHFTFSAGLISLTAAQTPAGEPPKSGRLTLNRAAVTYHGRRLFRVPRYSVSVGQLHEPRNTPLPTSGFNRDDGPFATLSYTLGRPEEPTLADLSYRYTSFRGIRGYLRLRRALGPAEVTAAYARREDAADQELRADEIHFTTANVLVSRSPEYGVNLPDLALGRSLHLRAEWLRGAYSESLPRVVDTRTRADRDSVSLLLTTDPYPLAPRISLSHAIGWRRSTYSPGDQLTISLYRHTVNLAPTPRASLALSYITRGASGQTPFLFDQAGIGRQLLADLRWRVTPAWRVNLEEAYDLSTRQARDMGVSFTRTAHCLDYTFGWRKVRGSFFITVGLAPPADREALPSGQ